MFIELIDKLSDLALYIKYYRHLIPSLQAF